MSEKSIVHLELQKELEVAYDRIKKLEKSKTKRKQLKKNLRKKEENYKQLSKELETILDNIPGPIFYKDRNNKFIRVNKYLADAHKMDKSELENKSLFDIYPLEQAEKYYRDDIRVIESGKAEIDIMEPWLTEDGERWVNTSKIPIKDDNENIIGVLGLAFDITERKKAKEALKESEERFRDLLFISADWIWEVDKNAIYTKCSEGVKKILGYSPEEVTGKSPFEFMPPDEAKRVGEIFAEIVGNKGDIIDLEHRTISKDGKKTCILSNGIPIFDINGNLKGYRGIDKDITVRKKAEEALQESKDKYKHIFTSFIDLYYMTDNNGVFTSVSPSCFKLLGYKQEELIGRKITEFYDEPENRTEFIRRLANDEVIHDYENILLNKDGEKIYTSVNSSILRDENGKIDGVAGTIRNINKQKQTEKEAQKHLEDLRFQSQLIEEKSFELNRTNTKLYESEEILKEANATKDKFFSIIAHDLRGPFVGFIGLAEMMSESLEDLSMKDINQMSKSITSSAKRLYTLLENLLEWSRMQRGQIDYAPEDINILEVADYVNSSVSSAAENKEIKISNLTDKDLRVFADRNMFDTVLRNLVSNAIKFTNRGGKIDINAEYIDDFVDISIADNGVGMNEDIVAKLFKLESKVSTPGTEEEPSTGLGLVLCKEFIEKHGGRIWVESEVGEGSTFHFTLPKGKN